MAAGGRRRWRRRRRRRRWRRWRRWRENERWAMSSRQAGISQTYMRRTLPRRGSCARRSAAMIASRPIRRRCTMSCRSLDASRWICCQSLPPCQCSLCQCSRRANAPAVPITPAASRRVPLSPAESLPPPRIPRESALPSTPAAEPARIPSIPSNHGTAHTPIVIPPDQHAAHRSRPCHRITTSAAPAPFPVHESACV